MRHRLASAVTVATTLTVDPFLLRTDLNTQNFLSQAKAMSAPVDFVSTHNCES